MSDFPESVTAGVERELRALPVELRMSGLAATALALAGAMDGDRRGSVSECAKALRDILITLRELAPPVEEEDTLDELTAKRLKRIQGGATPSN